MKAFIVVLLALVTMAAAADVHRRLFLRKCVMSVAVSQKSLMISFPGVIPPLSLSVLLFLLVHLSLFSFSILRTKQTYFIMTMEIDIMATS